MAADDATSTGQPDVHALEEQLEEVGQEIDEARKLTRQADDDDPKFYESGTEHPELDDQAIAP